MCKNEYANRRLKPLSIIIFVGPDPKQIGVIRSFPIDLSELLNQTLQIAGITLLNISVLFLQLLCLSC